MRLVARMALVAVVIGTSVSVAAVERVDVSLVASGTLSWAFVPVLQLFTGFLLVRGTSGERARQLDGYFSGHWPWSLWILGLHAVLLTVPPARAVPYWLMITAAIPVYMTVRLLDGFCRETLKLPPREARLRIATHQAVSFVLILLYVGFATALWPRIVGAIR